MPLATINKKFMVYLVALHRPFTGGEFAIHYAYIRVGLLNDSISCSNSNVRSGVDTGLNDYAGFAISGGQLGH